MANGDPLAELLQNSRALQRILLCHISYLKAFAGDQVANKFTPSRVKSVAAPGSWAHARCGRSVGKSNKMNLSYT